MTTPVPTTAAAHLAMVEALREAARGGTTYKKSKTAARAALEGWEKRPRLAGSPEHVALWDAINRYAESCGGDPSARTVGAPRMKAVVEVERAIETALFGTGPRTGGEGG